MSYKAYTNLGSKKTPQSEPIPGSDQAQNNAGGFTWVVDDWKRLDRFLILGTEGGTYYVQESRLSRDNAEAIIRCIQENGKRVVERIVEISEGGRAVNNDPALFALALCSGIGNSSTKQVAFAALPRVARIGTHLFHYIEYSQSFRGWGRGLREAVAKWYNSKPADSLSFQTIKYQKRDGWTHLDALRLAHPLAPTKEHNALYHWIARGDITEGTPILIEAYDQVLKADNAAGVVRLINEYNLPREVVPTKFLDDVGVWEALLQKMPMTATIRNLGKMTSIGLLNEMGSASELVIDRITNLNYLVESREHPLGILLALKTYQQGKGVKGSLSWAPVPKIIDALDKSFYLSFKSLEPTGKRTVLAIDASGSMDSMVSGMPFSCREAAVAMALITANIERDYTILGYTCNDEVVELPILPGQTIEKAQNILAENINFGGTDCSLPLRWAIKSGLKADVIIQYTDNETWAGEIHPQQALNNYRKKIKTPVKMVVVGMVANDSLIGDPNDSGILEVVGFDTATPNIISDFCRE